MEVKQFEVHKGMRTYKFKKNPNNFIGVELESHQTVYPYTNDDSLVHLAGKHFNAEIARLSFYFYKPIVSIGPIEKNIVVGKTRRGKDKIIAIFTCPIEITEGDENG